MKFAIALAAIMWSLVAVKALQDKDATTADAQTSVVVVQADTAAGSNLLR